MEPEIPNDHYGQVVTTVGEFIDPYLKAREGLFKELNRRWSELEQGRSILIFGIYTVAR